ncbi:MAG: hypothetical protein U9O87_00815 [Verrucomicrobiota bacterium]|nr:hypothetical protein [Verrucomicrobiota bacterium]
MKIKQKIVIYIIILLSILLLYANMSIFRASQEIKEDGAIIENVPPSLALITFAVGPLRGIIVDFLWWRAIDLQDKGEFFEAIQLADWITKLQPQFESIWAYQGWNLAYNVAYEFPEKEDRWKWIMSGLQLMRDEGLTYNPDSSAIKNEISRIFYDKIGGVIDPGGEYFREEWAKKMVHYFETGTREELIKLSEAPLNKKELFLDEKIKKIVDTAENEEISFAKLLEEAVHLHETELHILKHHHEIALKLKYYSKARKIRDELKMAPKRILQLDREYGPFDWRVHHAHAVYWAAKGTYEEFVSRGLNYAPVIRQSMIASFRNGRLFYDSHSGFMTFTNNLDIFGRVHDYFHYFMENDFSQKIDSAHKSFLEEGVPILYTFNHQEEAKELFHHYKEDYPKDAKGDFNDFLMTHMNKVLRGEKVGDKKSLVISSLYQAFLWYSTGDENRASGYERLAKIVWSSHQKKNAGSPGILLPPFDELKKTALKLASGSTSTLPLSLRKSLETKTSGRIKVEFHPHRVDKVKTGKLHSDFHDHSHKEKKKH